MLFSFIYRYFFNCYTLTAGYKQEEYRSDDKKLGAKDSSHFMNEEKF